MDQEETNEEATITITIKKTGEKWTSAHELRNIDPLVAAVVMIDVGRDLILEHHLHGHGGEHGDTPAES